MSLKEIFQKHNILLEDSPFTSTKTITFSADNLKDVEMFDNWAKQNLNLDSSIANIVREWTGGQPTDFHITKENFQNFSDRIGLKQAGFRVENDQIDKVLSGIKNLSNGAYEHLVKFWHYLEEQSKLLSAGGTGEDEQMQIGIRFIVLALALIMLSSLVGRKSRRGYYESNSSSEGVYLSENLMGSVSSMFNKAVDVSAGGVKSSFTTGLKIAGLVFAMMGMAILYKVARNRI